MRPFFRDSARFFTALKPGAKALGETSPVIAEALHAGVPALNASPVLNNQLQPTAEALVAFQDAPGRLQRPRPPDRHQRTAEAGAEVHRPVADPVQLRHPRLQEPGELQQRRQRARATGSTSSPSSRRKGPNSEGGPSSAPANGPRTSDNHLHFNPYPNTGAPGQPNGCEAGNEKYAPGKTVIGNAAEVWGTTTRGQVEANEPPARARHQAGRQQEGPLQVAAEQRRDRDRLHPHLHDRPLPRLHQTRALHQLRLRAERDLRQLGQHRARTRRCGSPASKSAK